MLKKLFGRNKKKYDMDSLLAKIQEIRTKSDTIAICPLPTGGNWLGISNATKSLYPDGTFEIPQWYSNQLLSQAELEKLYQKIISLKFSKVVLSGFPYYFFSFAENLHTHCSIQTLFHGTISEFYQEEVKTYISKNIEYIEKGIIHEFAFIKPGLDDVFHKLYGIKTMHSPLPTPSIPTGITRLQLQKDKKHIGVFGGDNFNKNLHNQVLAALLIENTVLHVLDASTFEYLRMGSRIVGHGSNLPRLEFLSLLASMDLNLYMSYSESWGLIAYESEALGVKCVRMDDIDYAQKIRTALS